MRYVHTNLIVRDVERAVDFYRRALGCVPSPPARDLGGEWLARGTGVDGAALRGMHLALPGASGVTLEIYTYAEVVGAERPVANRVGFGHLAFEVADVAEALARVRRAGGDALGEIVTHDVEGVGRLTFTYARDPEGNILELQRWHRREHEASVEELYDAWAARYDADDNPTRELAERTLRQMLPPLAGRDVVELGCGPGNNTRALLAAPSVVAMDFSSEMLARARAAISAPRVRFVAHDLHQPLPLPSGSADLVVLSLVLEHLERLGPLHRECVRVARSGGELLVLELHPERQRLGKRAHVVRGDQVIAAPAHHHTVAEHVTSALDAGFTLTEIREVHDADALDAPPRLLALRFVR